MSNFFRDKEFEEMGWLGQACEPYIFSMQKIIDDLPEEIPVRLKDLLGSERIEFSHTRSTPLCIRYMHANDLIKKYVSVTDYAKLINITRIFCNINRDISLYKKDVCVTSALDLNEASGDTILLKFKKSALNLTDETIAPEFIQRLWLSYANSLSASLFSSDEKETRSRMANIADLFNLKSAIKAKRVERYYSDLVDRISLLFRDKKLDVRNMDLVAKIYEWIRSYITVGTLSGFANLSKLKCMTISGNPIYSIEEIV